MLPMRRPPPPRDYADVRAFPEVVEMRPVGVVRSPHLERHGTPRQAALRADPEARPEEEARVEIFAPYREALRDLAGFGYVFVLSFFHLNQGWNPTVVPPRGPRTKRGLFATRAPHRPNPIGLSVAKIVRVEADAVVLERVDLLDGTPVLDLKPYLPSVDAFPEARAGWVDEVER